MRAIACLAVVLAIGLSACAGQPVVVGASESAEGYLSADGSVQSWPAGRRGDPVTITGTDYEGRSVDSSEWLGQVVVVNTWYAACGPCRKEAPTLVQLAGDYAEQGVQVLGLNSVDEAGAAQSFQREFAVPYPSIEDRDGAAAAALSGAVPLQAVPTTVVLDHEGRVAARIIGLAQETTLFALVEEVLAEVSSPSADPSQR